MIFPFIEVIAGGEGNDCEFRNIFNKTGPEKKEMIIFKEQQCSIWSLPFLVGIECGMPRQNQ
jgi:hypothetical protein